jgi:hypothetical protein
MLQPITLPALPHEGALAVLAGHTHRPAVKVLASKAAVTRLEKWASHPKLIRAHSLRARSTFCGRVTQAANCVMPR